MRICPDCGNELRGCCVSMPGDAHRPKCRSRVIARMTRILGGGFYQRNDAPQPKPKLSNTMDETVPCRSAHCVNKGSVHTGDHTARDGSRYERVR